MWQHLEENHVEEYRKAKEKAKESGAAESPGSNREKSNNNLQQTLPQVLQAKNPYPKASTRWKTLTDLVCYFIAKDMQPYQM